MSDTLPLRDKLGRLLPGQTLAHGKRAIRYNREEVARICQERNYHPIHHLIDIATNPETSAYVQRDCANDIASYLMPKLRTVNIAGADGEGDGMLRIHWQTDPVKTLNQVGDAIVEAIVSDDTTDD
jgi:hypothetical protein